MSKNRQEKETCDVCGAGFDTKQKLGSHRFRKHGIRVREATGAVQAASGGSEGPQVARPPKTWRKRIEPFHAHFCPRCGLNVEVVNKAISLADKMAGDGR